MVDANAIAAAVPVVQYNSAAKVHNPTAVDTRVDFCLIFVPFGHCDEPEILPYENSSACPIGSDVRHGLIPATDAVMLER